MTSHHWFNLFRCVSLRWVLPRRPETSGTTRSSRQAGPAADVPGAEVPLAAAMRGHSTGERASDATLTRRSFEKNTFYIS